MDPLDKPCAKTGADDDMKEADADDEVNSEAGTEADGTDAEEEAGTEADGTDAEEDEAENSEAEKREEKKEYIAMIAIFFNNCDDKRKTTQSS
ncbi:MAG: hypothetical protein SGILL_007125, partial [Bacillariaceae sp.]